MRILIIELSLLRVSVFMTGISYLDADFRIRCHRQGGGRIGPIESGRHGGKPAGTQETIAHQESPKDGKRAQSARLIHQFISLENGSLLALRARQALASIRKFWLARP
jgi:hypothetical protein